MERPMRSGKYRRGFTLIEILIVVSIIGILVSIAVPIYQKSILRTRESVLRNNLFTMRTVLDEYTYDKQKAPQTLEDLVTEGYLRQVPYDPMTNTREWGKRSMQDDPKSNAWGGQNVFSVYTNSMDKARDGTPYAEW